MSVLGGRLEVQTASIWGQTNCKRLREFACKRFKDGLNWWRSTAESGAEWSSSHLQHQQTIHLIRPDSGRDCRKQTPHHHKQRPPPLAVGDHRLCISSQDCTSKITVRPLRRSYAELLQTVRQVNVTHLHFMYIKVSELTMENFLLQVPEVVL